MPRANPVKKRKTLRSSKKQNTNGFFSEIKYWSVLFILLLQTGILFLDVSGVEFSQIRNNIDQWFNREDSQEHKYLLQKYGDSQGAVSVDSNFGIVRLGINNGCGINGLASEWKEKMRKAGYDVTEVGNAKHIAESMIIIRIQNKKPAFKLAEKLGIRSANIIQMIDPNIVTQDLTLVIGKDYKKLKIDWIK